MKLRANRGGHGHVTNYTLSIGSQEARELGFTRKDGSGRNLVKELDIEHGVLRIMVDKEAEALEGE